jgi:hypothetical protein
MKLCPLFESILWESISEFDPEYKAIKDCNDALPREAIEAAIHALEFLEFLPHPEAVNDTYIKQLRAMLPEGE